MNAVPSVAVADLPADAALLDVREDDEWAAGHAPYAQHVLMNAIPARVSEVPDPVYVICRTGGRSAQVTAFLNQQGRSAVNVEGGMQAWAAGGGEMVGEQSGVEPAVL